VQGAHWWLVCYDVHDPERLRKAAKHLEGYRERMQYSVFRCWLTRMQKEVT
jgi:CRISPR-associated protein Cas2